MRLFQRKEVKEAMEGPARAIIIEDKKEEKTAVPAEEKKEEQKVLVYPKAVSEADMLNLIYEQNNAIISLLQEALKEESK